MTYQQAIADAIKARDVTVDVTVDSSEATTTAGFGLLSFSSAATDVAAASSATDVDVMTAVLTGTTTATAGSGLSFFSSSVAAATTTVAANS